MTDLEYTVQKRERNNLTFKITQRAKYLADANLQEVKGLVKKHTRNIPWQKNTTMSRGTLIELILMEEFIEP